MQLTSSLVLIALGASSVSAAATPRHMRHQQFHEKKAVGDVVVATIDGQVVSWINQYSGGATATAQDSGAAPAATTTPAASPVVAAEVSSSPAEATATAAASTSSSTSAGNSESVSTYTGFCASSSKKRATVEQIAYKGNVGSTWGCNMMLVDDSIANQYDYTMKFTAQGSDEQQCVCWNKIGKDGGINGFFGEAAVTFGLPAGSSQTVAVDANSQGGCSCASGSVPKTSIGEWAGTWLEFDMANSQNLHTSGADVSALVAQSAGMAVQGMSVTAQGQSSSLLAGATNVNAAYVTGMEAADGVGLNLPAGNVALDVIVNYQG